MRLGEGDGDGGRREAFVQKLVFDHPDVIPMADIEPAFTPLISVCRELMTPAGPIDNLWITPAGGIVLGECKLVRNPQARREVVAQALDYARAIGDWRYEDLEREVRKSLKKPDGTIWSLVEGGSDLEEHQFVDAVNRRLRIGQLMILIIGDGIQEGVEALTQHLQLHAGIHAGMALVDLSIWDDGDRGLLVVPRVPMKTVLIERGIVTFNPADGVQVMPARVTAASATAKPRAISSSEPEFYDQLDQRRPGLSARLRAFLDSIADLGITPDFPASLVLRWPVSPDVEGRAGFVEKSGKVYLQSGWVTARKLDRLDVGERYLEVIRSAVGGQVRRYETSAPPEVVGGDGRALELGALLDHADEWRRAIEALIDGLRDSGGQ
ncbi:MAG: hypothetical protein JO127_17045 [Caulobacteraceae bacterium]|nr:hypothetical protein [Caulobacteraceae bacterium]